MAGNGKDTGAEAGGFYCWKNIRRVLIFDSHTIVTRALAALLIFAVIDLIGLQSGIVDQGVFALFCLSMMFTEKRAMKDMLPFPIIFQMVRCYLFLVGLQGSRNFLTSYIRPYYKLMRRNDQVQDSPLLQFQWILFQMDAFISHIGIMFKVKMAILTSTFVGEYVPKIILWIFRQMFF